jgi:hypothetical protein
MASFDLVLQTSGSLHPQSEPTDFVSEYTGIIRCTRDRDNKVCSAGKVHAYRIHAGLAANHRESLFDVCDAYSHEMHVLHTLLYEPNSHGFQEPLIDRFHAVEPDCLVLDYVLLNPRWRGLKLGLLAVRKLVDLIGGGCGLVVSEILPLHPDADKMLKVPKSWLPRHQTPEERNQGVVKLRRYFRAMGFKRLGRTSYYAMPTAQVTPSAAELLKVARK